MRVLSFWEPAGLVLDRANPYAGLLAYAIAPLGVETVAGYRENLTPHWMQANAASFDVIHLHWPWGLYYADTLPEALKACAAMMDALLLARSMGCRIVWTMHNLYPHDSDNHDLDHLARLAIVATSSAVIVHCEAARQLLQSYFHRTDGVFTIPHGHFMAPYPNTISTEEARKRFGFDDRHFVYLFFGTVRENKGVEQLVECFRTIEGDHLRFLFAARVCSDYGRRVVEAARESDPRIVSYETERFANDEFHGFYNAADIAVFPFTDILTSGSAITSLGFYCPVVVPALGCLPALVDPSVGYLYDSRDPDGLRMTMQKAASGPRRDGFRAGIERKLQELNWENIAAKTLEAYRHERDLHPA
jgi:beta-1,4-mannosyltransferase